MIAVASGKGGVGKSSVTVNLAMALAAQGRTVGVLDADIYGHSVPGHARGRRLPADRGRGHDHAGAGRRPLKVISIGMLKPRRDQVVAWRGPILDRALTQMLADVYWGDLDFLLLDLPPGTGDVAISLGQKLPNAEVLVVTTPQAAAAEVAERAGTMASMMNQRVIGVVENMSYLEVDLPALRPAAPARRSSAPAAAPTSPRRSSTRLGYAVPLLAQIPLDPQLRAAGDDGVPLVSTRPRPAGGPGADRRWPTPWPAAAAACSAASSAWPRPAADRRPTQVASASNGVSTRVGGVVAVAPSASLRPARA